MLYSDFDFSSFPKAPRSIRVKYSFNFSNVFFFYFLEKYLMMTCGVCCFYRGRYHQVRGEMMLTVG